MLLLTSTALVLLGCQSAVAPPPAAPPVSTVGPSTTPSVWPTPRPIDLPLRGDLPIETANWSTAHAFGLSFIHPHEYQPEAISTQEADGIVRSYLTIARWIDVTDGPVTRTPRDDFVTLFVWDDPNATAIATADDLKAWEAGLPRSLDSAGGRFDVTGSLDLGEALAWVVLWESLPDLYPPLQSVVLVAGGRVVMINLNGVAVPWADLNRWDQLMILLASIEVSQVD